MRFAPSFLVVMSLALVSLPSHGRAADSLPITPGLWEMSVSGTFFGQPHQEVENKCVRDDRFDPTALMRDAEGCQAENVILEGNTLSFDQVCQAGGSQINGHISMTVDGDTGNGTGALTIMAGGQTMEMNYEMTAKRLGDC